MSQGELHALALALFLPRATMPDSPFRFVILDDPIQAMDPAKIDGLVRVLGKLAGTRQVIVFSHDDRLPETVRRMAVPARILEVTRGVNSTVQVTSVLDPARRYLDDAVGIALDQGVPDQVRTKVIPGLCRMALEAAARDLFFTRRYAAAADRATVEADWQNARTVRQRLVLAIHDSKQASLDAWVTAKPWRKTAVAIANTAVHTGLRGDPRTAVREVERTVNDLQAIRA